MWQSIGYWFQKWLKSGFHPQTYLIIIYDTYSPSSLDYTTHKDSFCFLGTTPWLDIYIVQTNPQCTSFHLFHDATRPLKYRFVLFICVAFQWTSETTKDGDLTVPQQPPILYRSEEDPWNAPISPLGFDPFSALRLGWYRLLLCKPRLHDRKLGQHVVMN